MRKAIVLGICLLIFQNVAAAGGSDLKGNGLPRTFLSKSNSNVVVLKQGESLSVWSNGATLEEVLERIAEEKRVALKFFCRDPVLKNGRSPTSRISGDSIGKVLRELVSEDYRFAFLDREGKETENGRDIASVNICPKGCDGSETPVRVFIGAREHPLLKKPPEQISIEELRDVLKREGPSARRRALETLGIKGDVRGIEYAKEALREDNPRVMLAAADALKRSGKKYGPEKVVDAIDERFREKPYAELLLALAELDKERVWPIIDRFMDQPNRRDDATITRVLLLTNDRRAIKHLSSIVGATNIENSRHASYAIGAIGGPEAEAVLMRLLRQGDVQRQALAAQAVHFLPEGDGMDVRAEVEKLVRKEGVPDVLLHALTEVHYLEPFEKLMKDPSSKGELKVRASSAMVERATEKTVDIIGMGLNDDSPQVRAALIQTLIMIGLDPAIPYVIRATEDRDVQVRRIAVKGLPLFPWDDRVVEALDKAVDDADETVRREAVDALVVLRGTGEGVKAILDRCRLHHKDPYVAGTAESVLGRGALR